MMTRQKEQNDNWECLINFNNGKQLRCSDIINVMFKRIVNKLLILVSLVDQVMNTNLIMIYFFIYVINWLFIVIELF